MQYADFLSFVAGHLEKIKYCTCGSIHFTLHLFNLFTAVQSWFHHPVKSAEPGLLFFRLPLRLLAQDCWQSRELIVHLPELVHMVQMNQTGPMWMCQAEM